MAENIYYYEKPPSLGRKINRGDTVEVRDSRLESCGYVKVARTSRYVVETVDGRHWRPKDGYWLNEEREAFPFPSVHPVNLKLQEPDKERMKFLAERGFTLEVPFDVGHLEKLKRRLLNMAGCAVVLPMIEEDFVKIMERGSAVLGLGITMKRGSPSRCHSNSAALWEANQDNTSICTGYSLGEDAVWRQHTWCVFTDTGAIIETTERGRMYYGFTMDRTESELFLFENW